jgi:hypothetical protein
MATARIRFASARDVFEAFPTASDDLEAKPTDEPPLAFVKALMRSDTPEDAVGFCAYMLPRREAVWWACQCVRTLNSARTSAEDKAIAAAEDWVREPEEERRRTALDLGSESDRSAPATWAALAAGWSGGSMTPSDQPAAPCPPHLTAKAVRAAVLTALARVPVKERSERMKTCLEEALRLVGEEPARKRL